MNQILPYRSTPVFDQETLPNALRRAHSTKAGVWGILKVLKGKIVYSIDGSNLKQIVHAPGKIVICPEQLHAVEPLGDMEMQVDFYNEQPLSL